MELDDLKKGDVFYMGDPVRVCKVVGFEQVQSVDPKTRKVSKQKTAVVRSTLPKVEIPGFVDSIQAAEFVLLRKDLTKANETEWTEIWAERGVPHVEVKENVAATIGDPVNGPFDSQLYCMDEKGRATMRTRTSTLKNKPITGTLIPPKDVPADLFAKE